MSDPNQVFVSGELFCGAGGLTRGFHNQGFQSLFANDVWDVALHTYLMNFDPSYHGDRLSLGEILALPGSIEDIDGPSIARLIRSRLGDSQDSGVDVLLGGPPCQGFSLNSHNRSADDPRNYLFKHYVRVLHELSPKVFVFENVPGMLSLDQGRFVENLLRDIRTAQPGRSSGYDISMKILNAAHYGVPQERFRLFVVGTRLDVADAVGSVTLPKPVHYSLAQAHFKGGRSHTFHHAIGHRQEGQTVLPFTKEGLLAPVSVREAVGDLPQLSNGGGVDLREYHGFPPAAEPTSAYQRQMRDATSLANHWCRRLMPPNTERIQHIPARGDWRSIPHELLPPGMKRALRKDHTTRYGRLDPDGLSGTILTKPDPHWGTFIHYDLEQQRLISVREAARLQSFPDSHVFHGSQVDQYRQVGNAVPPLMAEAVAREVRAVLCRDRERSGHTEVGGALATVAGR